MRHLLALVAAALAVWLTGCVSTPVVQVVPKSDREISIRVRAQGANSDELDALMRVRAAEAVKALGLPAFAVRITSANDASVRVVAPPPHPTSPNYASPVGAAFGALGDIIASLPHVEEEPGRLSATVLAVTREEADAIRAMGRPGVVVLDCDTVIRSVGPWVRQWIEEHTPKDSAPSMGEW